MSYNVVDAYAQIVHGAKQLTQCCRIKFLPTQLHDPVSRIGSEKESKTTFGINYALCQKIYIALQNGMTVDRHFHRKLPYRWHSRLPDPVALQDPTETEIHYLLIYRLVRSKLHRLFY